MGKLALVVTVKAVSGKRDEYVKHLKAHAQRCLAAEAGTLEFEILAPKEEADMVLIYEVFASSEALEAHRAGPSKKQAARDTEGLTVGGTSRLCDMVN